MKKYTRFEKIVFKKNGPQIDKNYRDKRRNWKKK